MQRAASKERFANYEAPDRVGKLRTETAATLVAAFYFQLFAIVLAAGKPPWL